jgi:peroxiredoxin
MQTLTAAFAALSGSLRDQAPAPVLASIDESLAALARSGLTDRALRRGDLAPDFALPDATGAMVELRQLLSRGPLVLSFYRGAWCPYCNLELHAWQRHLPELERLGATLVAISPQTPDASLTLAEKHALAYPVLSDRGNVVARRFGVVYTVDERMRAVLEGFGVHLSAYNGDSTFELPVPATFLVAKDATIVGAWIDADYRRRAEPSVVLDLVRAIVGSK